MWMNVPLSLATMEGCVEIWMGTTPATVPLPTLGSSASCVSSLVFRGPPPAPRLLLLPVWKCCACGWFSQRRTFTRVPGCTSLLGMEGGAIAESQISASSVHYGILGLQRWGPNLARLNNQGIVNAWTSAGHDRNPWIEVRGKKGGAGWWWWWVG